MPPRKVDVYECPDANHTPLPHRHSPDHINTIYDNAGHFVRNETTYRYGDADSIWISTAAHYETALAPYLL